MIIPHLHFCGDCKEAIAIYEKAFDTTVGPIDYMADGIKIANTAMDIQGQRVFLNDNFGNRDRSIDCAVHLILTFRTAEELLSCYELLKDGGNQPAPFVETPYSKLVGNFMDRFGVLWGFMVTDD